MCKVSVVAAALVAGVVAMAGCAIDPTGTNTPAVNGVGGSGAMGGAGGILNRGGAGGFGGAGGSAGGSAGAGGTAGAGAAMGGAGAGGVAGGGGSGGEGYDQTGGSAGGGAGGSAPDAPEGDGPVTPDLLGNGALCSSSSVCASGSCVDGVCCETACTDTCTACSAAKTGALDGQCRAIKLGSDPDNECDTDPGEPCGRTGLCGADGCAIAASGTVCGAASCVGNQRMPAPACDGAGTCLFTAPAACPGDFKCASATTCGTSCDADNDCADNGRCDKSDGKCKPRLPLGAACTANGAGKNDCASGHCIDGVCCESACTGACRACAQGKTGVVDGQCAAVKAGIDPDNDCAAESPSTCGKTGLCDGSGACKLHPDGTLCGTTCCNSGPGGARPCMYLCKQGQCDTGAPVPSAETCGGFTCCCPNGAGQGQAACTLPFSCGGGSCM